MRQMSFQLFSYFKVFLANELVNVVTENPLYFPFPLNILKRETTSIAPSLPGL